MSRINGGMFTSDRMDWQTPDPLFRMVDDEFGFTLDAAASADNAKVPEFLSEEDDALTQEWPGRVWCNPPYGRSIGKWVEKGYREAQGNAEVVVMLIPARTDTSWWHDYVMRAAEIRLIRGRPVFVRGDGATASNAPFPCALVVFKPGSWSPAFGTASRGALLRRAA